MKIAAAVLALAGTAAAFAPASQPKVSYWMLSMAYSSHTTPFASSLGLWMDSLCNALLRRNE